MLVRLHLRDLLSFHDSREFNMLPQPRYSRLKHHIYNSKNSDVLKLSAIYGPNGSGKSNLIKSLDIVKQLVVSEVLPVNITKNFFKLTNNSIKPSIVIEFIASDIQYLYGVELSINKIITEELYISGLGKKADELVFERKLLDDDSIVINFSREFELIKENKMLKSIIEKNFIKKDKSMLKFLADLDNESLSDTKKAYLWFKNTLQIVTPDSRVSALPHLIDIDQRFHKYAENIMCSFNIGINSFKSYKTPISNFFKNEEVIESLSEKLKKSDSDYLSIRDDNGIELVIVEENNKIYVKQIKIGHSNKKNETFQFDVDDESDGTIRLIDFIPIFGDLNDFKCVYIIDEIERSIHPLLIKELVSKLSNDHLTQGQLIFSTHESNLLDQEILRQDEIWFVEKDNNGCSDLYSLSDFKEHNTKDIRKGYLQGRYGSIPFISNLRDLNWHKYDFRK